MKNSSAQYVNIGGIDYNLGLDNEGRATASSHNQKHGMKVTLSFANTVNDTVIEDIIGTLKRDYIDKHIQLEPKLVG